MFLSNVSVLGQVWFELILLVGVWDGLTQLGVFTVSGDLILFGTLMDCIASSVGGLWYMGDWRFSRLIVYLSCSTNNLAATVHALFLAAVERNGWPSRVQSHKGGENVDVAASMLWHRGVNRESIITGLSVHNQCIEQLWRDTFVGIGHFFYTLFYHMEQNGMLESEQTSLICSVCITFFAQELTINWLALCWSMEPSYSIYRRKLDSPTNMGEWYDFTRQCWKYCC